jgi:hypothetical protein
MIHRFASLFSCSAFRYTLLSVVEITEDENEIPLLKHQKQWKEDVTV